MATTLVGSPGDNARGAVAMLTGVLLFSVMEAMVKWLTTDYPVQQIIFFRSFCALFPCAWFIWRAGGPGVLRTRKPMLHALRGGLGLLGMGATFLAYKYMALADAKAILFAAPLFMTVLSIPLLGERVGIYRWSAVVVGFVGVLIILRPGGDMVLPGAAWALGAAVLYALVVIVIRYQSGTENVATIVFYFTLTGTIAGAVLVAAFGWVTPDPFDLALLVTVGVVGGFGQYYMTLAFRLAETAAIAPLDYTSLAWAILFGYAIWNHVPSPAVFAGIALVTGSGLFIMYRERKLARSR
jgi:drug/metabolite transporter (DMT)-like permease